MSTFLSHAEQYAELGWFILPVSIDKKPLISRGFHGATRSKEVLRNWSREFPDAGVAVATGAISGIVVLDIDEKDSTKRAEDTYRLVLEEMGELRCNVIAKSGGGGYHFYFKHPGNSIKVPNATRFLGIPQVDIRGDGGYIILPPSKHNKGGVYEWLENSSPFDVESLEDAPSIFYEDRPQEKGFQFSGEIPDGQRNTTLLSIGGLLRSLGLSFDEILAVLISQNSSRCVPPLPYNEVYQLATNIIEYPPYATNRPPVSVTVRSSNQSENAEIPHGTPTPQPEELTEPVIRRLLQFPWTDVGHAEMLAFFHYGKIRYDHTSGVWYAWDKHSWNPDDSEQINQKVVDAIRALHRASLTIPDEDSRRRAVVHALGLESISKIKNMLEVCRSLPGVSTKSDEWNSNPDLVSARNGVIDLKTGNLLPGHPDQKISKSLSVDYVPGVTSELWEQFMRDILSDDQEMIRFIQKAAGYSLSGRITEHCLFLLIGNGRNGKSTFLDVMMKLIGSYGAVTPFATFERTSNAQSQTNDLAALQGMRLIVSSETNEGSALNESRVKSLTGGDPITARFLHREFFTFHPVGKIWLAVNHAPRVHDDSVGFWSRVRRVDFKKQFLEGSSDPRYRVNKDLKEALFRELPGILNWVVEGAKAWYSEGLSIPATVVKSTETYRQDSDPLSVFFESYCEFDESFSILADEIYREYSSYGRLSQLKSYELLSSSRFHARLARQYGREGEGSHRRYIGIRLREDNRPSRQEGSIVLKSVSRN